MKLRVTPLSGLYSRIFNISLISRAPRDEWRRLCAVAYCRHLTASCRWLDLSLIISGWEKAVPN